MPVLRSFKDPITNKSYDYMTTTPREDHLYEVLAAACTNQCPPDTADYLCNGNDVPENAESEQCAACYRKLAAKVSGPDTPRAQRLEQAIELAIYDQCPPDLKDKICQASEDEDTSEETCTRCLERWATIPFARFKK